MKAITFMLCVLGIVIPSSARADLCVPQLEDAKTCGVEGVACTAADAQCEGKLVFDAAACGAQYLPSDACGRELITDAALCGIEESEKCGTETYECGSKWVTSAAECGTEILSDAIEIAKRCTKCIGDAEVQVRGAEEV